MARADNFISCLVHFVKYRVDILVNSTWYTIQHPMLSAETDGVRVEWS
jgi:hypothetical protein